MSAMICGAGAATLNVPNSFTSGSPAVAADVNANFTAVKSAVNDNENRIAALEAAVTVLQATINAQATTISTQAAAITTLQGDLATVNASNVMAMNPYVVVSSDARGPLVQLSGANVQVINGLGSTGTINGLGNLIIGYDEVDTSATAHCTVGVISGGGGGPVIDAATCATAGGLWLNTGFKSGSHYLVLGSENNYSRWGGLMAGVQNTSNFNYASVSGGVRGTASGALASVNGGWGNIASGYAANVSGGSYNAASNMYTSVSGGRVNTASGLYGSVGGGSYNTASGNSASVCGGGGAALTSGNTAASNYSTILGGVAKTTTIVGESMP